MSDLREFAGLPAEQHGFAGMPVPVIAPFERHILGETLRIAGREFKKCSCGWVAEVFGGWPTSCRVDDAEVACAHRIGLAKATLADELTRIDAVSRIEADEVQRLAGAR